MREGGGREGGKCEWGERKEWEGGMSREKGGVHMGGGRDEGGTFICTYKAHTLKITNTPTYSFAST